MKNISSTNLSDQRRNRSTCAREEGREQMKKDKKSENDNFTEQCKHLFNDTISLFENSFSRKSLGIANIIIIAQIATRYWVYCRSLSNLFIKFYWWNNINGRLRCDNTKKQNMESLIALGSWTERDSANRANRIFREDRPSKPL